MQEEMLENATNEMDKMQFNGTLELYKGSKTETSVKKLLDLISLGPRVSTIL